MRRVALLVLLCSLTASAQVHAVLQNPPTGGGGQVLDVVGIYGDTSMPWDGGRALCNANQANFMLDGPIKMASLVKWSLQTIPTGSMITAATIDMVHFDGLDPTTVHEMTRQWNQSATWFEPTMGASWFGNNPLNSGNFVASPLLTYGQGAPAPIRDAGIALIQRWVSNPATNDGLLLKTTSTRAYNAIYANGINAAPRIQVWGVLPGGGALDAGFRYGVEPAGYTSALTCQLAFGPQPSTLNWNGFLLRMTPEASVVARVDLTNLAWWGTVTGARLKIPIRNGSSGAVNVYALNRDWAPSTVTWNEAAPGIPWSGAGARGVPDRDGTLLSQASLGGTVMTAEITGGGLDAVQAWLEADVDNHGMVIELTDGGASANLLSDLLAGPGNGASFELEYFAGAFQVQPQPIEVVPGGTPATVTISRTRTTGAALPWQVGMIFVSINATGQATLSFDGGAPTQSLVLPFAGGQTSLDIGVGLASPGAGTISVSAGAAWVPATALVNSLGVDGGSAGGGSSVGGGTALGGGAAGGGASVGGGSVGGGSSVGGGTALGGGSVGGGPVGGGSPDGGGSAGGGPVGGGSPDGGGSDGGGSVGGGSASGGGSPVSGGSVGGGADDAGAPPVDAGTDLGPLAVRCGCQSSPATAWLLLLGLALVRKRR